MIETGFDGERFRDAHSEAMAPFLDARFHGVAPFVYTKKIHHVWRFGNYGVVPRASRRCARCQQVYIFATTERMRGSFAAVTAEPAPIFLFPKQGTLE